MGIITCKLSGTSALTTSEQDDSIVAKSQYNSVSHSKENTWYSKI